jgi:vitamin B12 transporter
VPIPDLKNRPTGPKHRRLATRASAVLLIAGLPATPVLAEEGGDAYDLGTVVFSANRTPTEEASVGSSVTVVSRKDIDKSGKATVSELLADIPGLGFSTTGPTGSSTTVEMRGLGARYVLVRIDGIDVSDPTQPQAAPALEHLMLGEIERIEVLRGSQSALYGGTAVAGVIDITTRTAAEKGVHHSATVGGGTFGTISGRYGVSASTDTVDVSAAIERYHTAGFSSADAANGNTEKDGYDNLTGSANWSYRPSEHLRLFAAARYSRHDSNYDDFVFDMLTGVGQPADETGPGRFHTIGKEIGGRVGADFDLFDGRLKNTLAVQHFHLDRDVYDSLPGHYEADRSRVEYLGNIALTDAVGLSFGLDYTDEDVSTSSGIDKGAGTAGAFVQGSWKPVDAVTLTAGLRDDHHSVWGDHPTGRLTAAWEATASTKLHASFGTGFRPPSLYELYAPFYGNPDLKPEESKSFDVGIDQHVLDDRGLVAFTFFNIDTDDLITSDPSTWRYVQIGGTSKSRGVELTGRLKVNDRLTLDAGYTYTDAEDSAGARLQRVPRHKVTAGATVKVDERTAVNLRGTWVGDSIDTDYAVGARRQLPDYLLIDAGLTWDWTDNVSLSLTGRNLLDQDYETVWGYGTAGRSVFAAVTAKY